MTNHCFYKKFTLLISVLGLSIFSLTQTAQNAHAITTTAVSASESTESQTDSFLEADSDTVSIYDITFQKSTASAETLLAYEELKKVSAWKNDWKSILVNRDRPLDQSYTFTQKKLPGYSMTVDERVYEPLLAMLDAGTKEGCRFVICSAYRSFDRQTQIYDSHISTYRARGYSYEQAKELTELSIAIPGSSEHQTGMAVDIVATYYQQLDDNFANTKEAQWLKEHCAEYGFILRYPQDKTEITKITFEPWHFRYVGVEIAKEVTELGLCYEEYIEMKESEIDKAAAKLREQVSLDKAYAKKYTPTGSWYSDETGYWFAYTDNTFPYRAWIQFGEDWRYFLPSGYMALGWLNLGENWYYFDEENDSGIMLTGWYQDTATKDWYYLNEENNSGEMLTGWHEDKEERKWYYFLSNGILLTSGYTPDGFYVNENGVWEEDKEKPKPSYEDFN